MGDVAKAIVVLGVHGGGKLADLDGSVLLGTRRIHRDLRFSLALTRVNRLVSASPVALLVAERENQIVGALIAAWDGWRGNMYRLAVRDDDRREGIGLALIRAGEDYLRQRGARRVTALVVVESQFPKSAQTEARRLPPPDFRARVQEDRNAGQLRSHPSLEEGRWAD